MEETSDKTFIEEEIQDLREYLSNNPSCDDVIKAHTKFKLGKLYLELEDNLNSFMCFFDPLLVRFFPLDLIKAYICISGESLQKLEQVLNDNTLEEDHLTEITQHYNKMIKKINDEKPLD
jgi:hypothetical protein